MVVWSISLSQHRNMSMMTSKIIDIIYMYVLSVVCCVRVMWVRIEWINVNEDTEEKFGQIETQKITILDSDVVWSM